MEEETKYIRLKINDKPYDLNLITFAPRPDDNEMIIAMRENTAHYFTDINDARYKWVAELRLEHAQRIANKFAFNLSRIGLDESEWLRLWATKG